MTTESKALIRCAIYTRKSSEEGLEQSFNSLDAQREACAAFVASQRHEGWRALPALYDDGGYSGGDMERPALEFGPCGNWAVLDWCSNTTTAGGIVPAVHADCA